MSAGRLQALFSNESAYRLRAAKPRKYPSILIEGEEASWTGDDMMMFGTVHFYKNIIFEAMVNNFDRKFINLKNIGSTVITIRWEKLPPRNNFEGIRMSRATTRFYFDPCPSILCPGESRDILLTFFSRKAGIFREQYRLHTRPVVAGGASLVFNLKGVAISDSDTNDTIEHIEADLAHRQVVRFISNIISYILNTVTSPEARTRRKQKRVSMEELFTKANPELYFQRDVVERLHNVYAMVASQVTGMPRQWDFSIETLESIFHEIKDPPEQLQRVNEIKESLVPALRRPHLTPFVVGPYHVVYLLWIQTIDAMVEEAGKLQAAIFREDDTAQATKGKMSRYGKTKDDKTAKIAVFKDVIKPTRKDANMEKLLGARMPFIGPAEETIAETLQPIEPSALSKYRQSLYLSTYHLMKNLVEFMACILDDMWPTKGECYDRRP